jgi:flagellar basal body-associated protein FliL
MAKEKKEQPTEEQVGQNANAAPKSIFGRMHLLLMLAGVVIAETVVAYFLLPSPNKVTSEVQAAMEETIPEELPYDLYEPDEKSNMKREEQLEVDLGEFTLTENDSASNTTSRLQIHFWALVDKDKEEDFLALFEERKNRIRASILEILRARSSKELKDPKLGLITNRILVKINSILGEPYVDNIIYTDFAWDTM